MFSRGDKTEADLVTDQAGSSANAERQTVKQWIQHAGMKLPSSTDALLAPGQVVDLFLGRVLHGGAYLRQLGSQCLALVKRLGRDFAGYG